MDRRGVIEGMTVRSADGEKLGKVVLCSNETFFIEKGFFFPKDYTVRYDQVSGIQSGEIVLAYTKKELQEGDWDTTSTTSTATSDSSYSDRSITDRDYTTGSGVSSGLAGVASGIGYDSTAAMSSSTHSSSLSSDLNSTSRTVENHEELRVPLAEEELIAEKRVREAGQVRIRKEVITEHKQITVPVTREEVHIEHVPVTSATAANVTSDTFREETVTIPVHEEQVEVHKRPVIREEVRITKQVHQESRTAEADLRKERLDVDRDVEVTDTDLSKSRVKKVRDSDIAS